jgi:hypothetical protein
MRRRMSQRHAGGQDQGRDRGPVAATQIGRREAGAGRVRDLAGIVVEGHDLGAAGSERAAGPEAG